MSSDAVDANRPSWDSIWMDLASMIACRSLCTRAQVGAVIVSSDNVVRAASYNGPPPKFDHAGRPCTEWCDRSIAAAADRDREYHDCPATHAEMSAIARADRSACEGATIYVNGAVCMSCAKVIPQTGISRVVHIVRPAESHRMPEDVERFLQSSGVTVARM